MLKKLLNKIMSLIIGAFEYIRGFIGNDEYEGYLGDEKVFPFDGIKIIRVWLKISAPASNKPEEIEQMGITEEGYLPACGGIATSCNVVYEVEEDGEIVRKLAENIPLKEGPIEALYLGDTITENTLLGVRHIDLNIDGYDPILDYEVEIFQQANLQKNTLDIVDVEASGPYHTVEYYDPVVTLSYTAMGANGQNTYALLDSLSYYQDYVTKDYNLAAITHDEIDYTSGLHIVSPQKGGNETDVVEQSHRHENEGADPFVWYLEEQTSTAVQFVNTDGYDHAVKGVNRGKTDYTGGKVAKVTLVVPMNGRRGLAQVDIVQRANTMTPVWRDLPKFNEYENIFTDIDISVFYYPSNEEGVTSWSIPASGQYRTPALVFSQQQYKDTYEVVGRTQLFNVWASGAEEATDNYYGGTRTLKKHEFVKTYGVADATSVTYSVDYWRNSGYWYNKSKGSVAAEDREDNPGETRTLGVVTVAVEMNGKTSTASTTVKQQYNVEEDNSGYVEIIRESDHYAYYEYKTPVISSFSYSTTNFAASGGTATPSYTVSQKYDEGVRYTTAVKQYYQYFTSHPTEPYKRGTIGGTPVETITHRDLEVPQSQLIIKFDGTALNGSGVTLESYDTGKINCPSLGTTEKEARNVWTAKIIVTGGGVRAEKTLTISQRENKIESESKAFSGFSQMYFVNASGNKIAKPSFEAAGGKLYIRLYGNYTTTYTYSSNGKSTSTSEDLFSRVDFILRISNTDMIKPVTTVLGEYKFNTTALAYEFNVERNTSDARSSTVQAEYNGFTKKTESISQAAGEIIAEYYCQPMLVQVASGSYGAAYRIDLIRTNKPISGASASVNYTLTFSSQGVTHTVTKALTIKSAFNQGDVVAMGVASNVNIVASSVTYTET